MSGLEQFAQLHPVAQVAIVVMLGLVAIAFILKA